MPVKEIEVTLKNEPGQLSLVSEILGSNGIDIVAFYVSTKGGQGSLRFVANDPEHRSKGQGLPLKSRGGDRLRNSPSSGRSQFYFETPEKARHQC